MAGAHRGPGCSLMLDMDLVLELWVAGLIEWNKFAWMLGGGESWKPGTKLKLLLAGYNGTRNTGSDVRVQEIVRQIRRILGADHIDLSVMSFNFQNSLGYFENARQVYLPDVYPPFLNREIRHQHGVIACEGSMFKSKFANALANMMIGSLGIAAAQNKLSVAYGGEAGAMDPFLQKMTQRFCRESFIITRNPASLEVLSKLGISSELGTDTAWTFEPLGPEYGRKALLDAGWDGTLPVVAICPINPFFWPVKPSLWRWLAHSVAGGYKKSYYRNIYFHRSGREVEAAYQRYLSAMTAGIQNYKSDHRVFPVLIAMEMLDRDACERMAGKLGGVPVFASDHYNMFELVSILRACHRMLSSRYHAIVTSMPAGVPSAGVAMDERIANLMRERGHEQHLLINVEDAELADRIVEALRVLDAETDEIRRSMGCVVARNLQLMARMGAYLEGHVARRYPEFPVRSGILSWEDYLPLLTPLLRQLVERHESALT
jgi:polysaccharide pyruvyl transferase WcaK-like protein